MDRRHPAVQQRQKGGPHHVPPRRCAKGNLSGPCTCGGCLLSELTLLFLQRHTAQLREELLKLPCPSGLEPDADHFSERSAGLVLAELPTQDAEKPGPSQDNHCSEG